MAYIRIAGGDIINIMNACLSKSPPRHDIIKEYSSHYHENFITNVLTTFWDSKHEQFEVNNN